MAQAVQNLPAMQESWVHSLGWEDSLEKAMATHSSFLAWRIPWTGEPGGLHCTGSQRVGHGWTTSTHTHKVWYYSLLLRTQMTSSMMVPESKTLNHGRERLRGESFNYLIPPYFLIPTFCNHIWYRNSVEILARLWILCQSPKVWSYISQSIWKCFYQCRY